MTITSDLDASANHLENFLKQNPEKVFEVAVAHYRRWKTLETENLKLAENNKQLKTDNSILLKRCQQFSKAYIELKKQSLQPTPTPLSYLLNSNDKP